MPARNILALALVLTLAACAPLPQPLPTPTPMPAPTRTPTAIPPTPTATPDPTTDWVAYPDALLGFTLRLPQDWYIYPATTVGFGETTIITSYDVRTAPPAEGAANWSRGHVKMECGILDIPSSGDMDPLASAAQALVANGEPPDESHSVTVSGYPALSLRIRDASGASWSVLLVSRGQHIFIASAGPSSEVTDLLLGTLTLE